MKRDEVVPAYVYPLPLGAAIVMLVVMTSDLASLQMCSADLDFSASKAGKKRARAMNHGKADALRAASNGRTKAPPIITQLLPADIAKAGAVLVALAISSAVLFQAFVLPSFATVVPLVNKAIPELMQIEVHFT